PRGWGIDTVLSIPDAVLKGVTAHPETTHDEAALIGMLTIGILVGWRLLLPKRAQLLPAPLVAIVAATALTAALAWPISRVPMPETVLAEVRWPTWANLSRVVEGPVLVATFTVAFIASAETLLCATAVDGMHTGPRTKYDKELAAQGVGNVLCGLLGALPMTGVIVRSATNVEAGARTRLSAMLHGVWLLVTVLFATALLSQVPVAALAAVLVYTGYRLVNLRVIRELWRFGWGEVAIYLCTMAAVVATNLLEGVLLGVAMSVAKLLWRFSHLEVRLEPAPSGNRTALTLTGAATFLRLPRLAAALEMVPPGSELHVQFEGLTYIDHACLELLMDWEKQHEATGGSLTIDWDTLRAKFHEGPNGHKVKGTAHANGRPPAPVNYSS
ncbi:MAG: SulP family inorganic anion transporter, partial [Gemmataceae bacterium]